MRTDRLECKTDKHGRRQEWRANTRGVQKDMGAGRKKMIWGKEWETEDNPCIFADENKRGFESIALLLPQSSLYEAVS